jgi:ferric-dicitrate binding protein FerR (iron transport regulator)
MKMENVIDKNMLFDNFAGRSTPLQKKMLEEWLESPANRELYYEWLDEWENGNSQFFLDESIALKKIMQQVDGGNALPGTLYKKGFVARLLRTRFMVAALVILLAGTGLFFLKDIILYQSMSTAFGETRSVVLPDGSLVSMNGNSSIRFARFGFGSSGGREIRLSGEADFSVVHTRSNLPFIVRTGNGVDVTVLGTQFTVYTRGTNARVVLKKGSVALQFREEKQYKKIVMQPGDLFTATTGGSNTLEHIQHPENLSAWKNHQFLFDGTSLSEIGNMFKDNFGLTVYFENAAIGENRISGSFHADTAAELLDVIAQLLNIHYKTAGNNIYFSSH